MAKAGKRATKAAARLKASAPAPSTKRKTTRGSPAKQPAATARAPSTTRTRKIVAAGPKARAKATTPPDKTAIVRALKRKTIELTRTALAARVKSLENELAEARRKLEKAKSMLEFAGSYGSVLTAEKEEALVQVEQLQKELEDANSRLTRRSQELRDVKKELAGLPADVAALRNARTQIVADRQAAAQERGQALRDNRQARRNLVFSGVAILLAALTAVITGAVVYVMTNGPVTREDAQFEQLPAIERREPTHERQKLPSFSQEKDTQPGPDKPFFDFDFFNLRRKPKQGSD